MNSRQRYSQSPDEMRQRRSSRTLVLAGFGALLFVVVACVSLVVGVRLNPVLDDALCPPPDRISSESVVILDATDPWDDVQAAVIRGEFARLQETIPRFGRVHLFVVEEGLVGLPDPLLQRCNPGTLDDLGRWKAYVFGNPGNVQRWRTEFVVAMDSVLATVEKNARGGRSPITETIRGAGATIFTHSAPSNRAIYLFSDMLQHSGEFSHYTSDSWSRAEGERLAEQATTMLLPGVRIEIVLVNRGIGGGGRGPGALVEFWEGWFSKNGAVIDRVRRI
jgi:hypothetical protein